MSVITFGRPVADSLVLGASPRVHLLPKEVDAQRKARSLRRTLLMGLGGAVAVVVIGVAIASIGLVTATAGQASEQAKAGAITAQLGKYGAVTSVQGQVSQIQAVQPVATKGEILWAAYVSSLQATLPAGTTITAFKATLDPTDSTVPESNPLVGDHVATVAVTAVGPQAAVQAWLAVLPSLKGTVAATPGNVAVSTTPGMYQADVNILVNSDVLSTRFSTTTKKK
jgi:hypothetical protein